jgi:L-rhamnose isomerase / sugar isomerase
MMLFDEEKIARANAPLQSALEADVDHLAVQLARDAIDVHAIIAQLKDFSVAVPSWGLGTGGTRFARFPGPGEPRNIVEKMEDCGVVQALGRMCRTVSLHFPWDKVSDTAALLEQTRALGLKFDAVNSNTFQDQTGQKHSYKFGSLTHSDASVRAQAIAHNIDCIELGQKLGSKALTVWIADGANFPGQSDFTLAFDRYLESTAAIYSALPQDWQMLIEHKFYEPAFYATVIADWGSSYIAATQLGPKAQCLVDLGHHAPSTNIEMIVARLARFGKLGGFHFNDSKYGDDDLDSGSIDPFRLFLIFHELVGVKTRDPAFAPAYMLDQSHNVTDPIESLITSADAIACAYARALLVNRDALAEAQAGNDVMRAKHYLQAAYQTDVRPLVAAARQQLGGAIGPIGCYRSGDYRQHVAPMRPSLGGSQSGIV